MDFDSRSQVEMSVEELNRIDGESEMRDFLAVVLGGAVLGFDEIDYLAPDNQLDLEKGFRILRTGLNKLYSAKLKPEEFKQAEELLGQSLSAFRIKDHQAGAKRLYEFELMLFGSSKD